MFTERLTQRFRRALPERSRYSTENRPSSTKPRAVAISVTVTGRPRVIISSPLPGTA